MDNTSQNQKTVSISTINIKVGERDIPLSLEESKQVYEVLKALFEPKPKVEPYTGIRSPKPSKEEEEEYNKIFTKKNNPFDPVPQWPLPSYPWIVPYVDERPWWDSNKVWCQIDNNTNVLNVGFVE